MTRWRVGVLIFSVMVRCFASWHSVAPAHRAASPSSCFALVLEGRSQVIVSGVFCFVLEKEWFVNLAAAQKIPMCVHETGSMHQRHRLRCGG